MPYRIAGIDVHKKMLAVVVADVEIDGDFQFARQKVGTTPADLRSLADWLVEQDVEQVVMESTAQDWRPVWEALEQHWHPRRRARRRLQALADSRPRACVPRPSSSAMLSMRVRRCIVYRRLLQLTLEELRVIEDHFGQLDQQLADLLAAHHDAVPKHLASWMGACPGNEESAGVNYNHRCPKGNRQMRRVLNQAANAAVKAKGMIFAVVYRRLVPRLGHAQAIGAITHRLCRLIWKILHQRVRYEERGPSVSTEAKRVRARKMIRELRSLGYHVELLPAPSSSPA